MKSLFLFLFITVVFFNSDAQTLEQNIREIRTQFKFINSQKDFQKVVFENEEFTDEIPSEGCGLEVYYKNGNLYKIIESDAASVNLYTTEYYFKNNQLIFVYRKEDEFTKIPGGKVVDTETIYEERTYYKNGNIIRHLEKGMSVLDKPLDYLELSEEYKKYYETKVKYEKQYDLLQGVWVNTDNNDDWFEISGTNTVLFDAPELSNPFRFWIEEGGRYIFFHYTNTNEDVKFEILELNDKNFQIQNRLTGEVLTYEKNKS